MAARCSWDGAGTSSIRGTCRFPRGSKGRQLVERDDENARAALRKPTEQHHPDEGASSSRRSDTVHSRSNDTHIFPSRDRSPSPRPPTRLELDTGKAPPLISSTSRTRKLSTFDSVGYSFLGLG